MAVALAQLRHPDLNIASACISVAKEGESAADQAITVMSRMGLDVRRHRTKSIANVELLNYDLIIALDRT